MASFEGAPRTNQRETKEKEPSTEDVDTSYLDLAEGRYAKSGPELSGEEMTSKDDATDANGRLEKPQPFSVEIGIPKEPNSSELSPKAQEVLSLIDSGKVVEASNLIVNRRWNWDVKPTEENPIVYSDPGFPERVVSQLPNEALGRVADYLRDRMAESNPGRSVQDKLNHIETIIKNFNYDPRIINHPATVEAYKEILRSEGINLYEVSNFLGRDGVDITAVLSDPQVKAGFIEMLKKELSYDQSVGGISVIFSIIDKMGITREEVLDLSGEISEKSPNNAEALSSRYSL